VIPAGWSASREAFTRRSSGKWVEIDALESFPALRTRRERPGSDNIRVDSDFTLVG
jgi:hypothetical protein